VKVGDLVRSLVSLTDECQVGIITRFIAPDQWRHRGAMILWDHGEVCYSPVEELEVINESR